ncbi:hypothetical protein PF005_g13347 [Phytophthora fragariae]|uniref:Polygalacturonase n=1 Tax=Phytophthora fragariae TaxID=53985 RepID=A0A6A3IQ09_9STRA|nr:hypothetical protein PF011_g21945 [Phytophthora fragariae]KAE9081509.1 hypothetical protein PF007_g22635 [Phytophthora fragariae]KAE9185454.1 hypothetical protein PF004_g23355 [Phytophthora fragariae]KAE9205569.1 hypothetical protein PF005_g13347 [Phytophthora fragariae]
MMFSTRILAAAALVLAAVSGNPMIRQEAEEAEASSCTLAGTYTSGTDVSSCSTVTISSLTVPAGVTLDLTDLKSGASVVFSGTTTFGTKKWAGPLVLLTGTKLSVSGTGTLDGQGAWYWKQGTSITRPVFFRMNKWGKERNEGGLALASSSPAPPRSVKRNGQDLSSFLRVRS